MREGSFSIEAALSDTLAALERARGVLPELDRAARLVAERLDRGGRLVYVGAGTSGRLAALDAAELPPTFGTDPSLTPVLMAGGSPAFLAAVEGAEDDAVAAASGIEALGVGERDAVLGVAASGTTPYVLAAVQRARALGALTLGLACTPGSELEGLVDVALVVETGPETPRGSSRMKAGTVQKVLLNLLSTAVMARRGLVYRDEMVAMRPTNRKLRARALRIVRELLEVPHGEAQRLLESSGWELPVALVAGRHRTDPATARRRLAEVQGNVARALGEEPLEARPQTFQ